MALRESREKALDEEGQPLLEEDSSREGLEARAWPARRVANVMQRQAAGVP